MTENELISEIEKFAERHGIAPATVTVRAVANSRLYHRLKAGGSCSMRTADRLRQWMADNSAPVKNEGAA